MSLSELTSWALVRAAAAGDADSRETFARRYAGAVRAYLDRRWRQSPLLAEADDAVQEVFVECFKEEGVLRKADPSKGGRFRTLLFAVVHNVARRFETRRPPPPSGPPADLADGQEDPAGLFDREFARATVREALRRQEEDARRAGGDRLRRVELLRLRFYEQLPIRDIARLWQADAAELHRAYARAREEFRAALREVVACHCPGTPAEIDQECADLVNVLR